MDSQSKKDSKFGYDASSWMEITNHCERWCVAVTSCFQRVDFTVHEPLNCVTKHADMGLMLPQEVQWTCERPNHGLLGVEQIAKMRHNVFIGKENKGNNTTPKNRESVIQKIRTTMVKCTWNNDVGDWNLHTNEESPLSEGMDENRGPGRVDTDHPWFMPSFCPVASRSFASTEAKNAILQPRLFRRTLSVVKSKDQNTKVARLEAAHSGIDCQEVLRKSRMEAKVVRHFQERAAEAADRINRRQSVVDFLGHDSPDAELLKVSLKKAQDQSRVRLLGERLASGLQFIARVKGRVSRTGQDFRKTTSGCRNVQQDLMR